MGVCASAPPADGGSASIPVPVKPAGGSVEWSDDVPSAYTTTSSSAMPSINSAPNIATVRNIVCGILCVCWQCERGVRIEC